MQLMAQPWAPPLLPAQLKSQAGRHTLPSSSSTSSSATPYMETGNHTHPSQLCEKTYIFSTHSVQYSNKSYHNFLRKPTNHKPSNHQNFPNPPHSRALILSLLGPTRHQQQVTPAPRHPCPTRHRGWSQISGSISCPSTRLLLWAPGC